MANEKPAEEKQLDLIARSAQDVVLWILGCGLLCGILFWIDDIDSTWIDDIDSTWRYVRHTITWAPAASIWIGIIGFNIAVADIIYHHAKRYGRNAVAWTTAFIVFSPVLACIAYLLTWPKGMGLK